MTAWTPAIARSLAPLKAFSPSFCRNWLTSVSLPSTQLTNESQSGMSVSLIVIGWACSGLRGLAGGPAVVGHRHREALLRLGEQVGQRFAGRRRQRQQGAAGNDGIAGAVGRPGQVDAGTGDDVERALVGRAEPAGERAQRLQVRVD